MLGVGPPGQQCAIASTPLYNAECALLTWQLQHEVYDLILPCETVPDAEHLQVRLMGIKVEVVAHESLQDLL